MEKQTTEKMCKISSVRRKNGKKEREARAVNAKNEKAIADGEPIVQKSLF